MDLKEFIDETMCAIIDATSELQDKYATSDVLINPPSAQSGNEVYQPNSPNYTMRRVQNIAFDVAVTASAEKSTGGKAGIKVMSLEIGGGGEMSDVSKQVSRANFNIPITLKPSDHEITNIEVRDTEDRAKEKAKKDKSPISVPKLKRLRR